MPQASLQAEPDQAACLHCGLPVPNNRHSFCCGGCEAIYATIHSLGLEEYYKWKRCALDSRERVEKDSSAQVNWSEFDVPEQQLLVSDGNPLTCDYTFEVMGIHCAGCVWLLERLPQISPAIERSVLNATTARLMVRYTPGRIKLSEIAALLSSLGYPPRLPGRASESDPLDRIHLARLGVAGFAALNTMMLAVSLFQGLFSGIDPAIANYFRWWSLFLALPAVVWAAWPLYRNAYSALRLRTLHIELPLSLAIIAAFLLSTYNTVTGRPYVYYDSMCALIFFLLVGRTFQERALAGARRRARAGWSVLPSVAERMVGDSWEEASLESLSLGDTVRVRAGQRIPADGVVLQGTSSIDRSTLTGESHPHEVTVGSKVLAGTLNIAQELLMHVVASGPRSRLAILLSQVEHAAHQAAPLERLTNRVARWYVYAVMFGALATFAWWSSVSIARGAEIALTLLIVTCPCALAFAAPTILGLMIGEAARRGILIKSPQIVELLAKARTFYFDKTGTLTRGSLELRHVELAEDEELSTFAHPLSLLTSVSPNHPISKSLRVELKLSQISAPQGVITPGRGTSVRINEVEWALGSRPFMLERGCSIPAQLLALFEKYASQGFSCQLLAHGTTVKALFVLTDSLRPMAQECLAKLAPPTSELHILSGDAQRTVTAIAAELAVPEGNAIGELLPEQKGEIVQRGARPTTFIGDGVNDIAALSAADIGIAFMGGLEPTLEAADVVITEPSLHTIVELRGAARRALRLVYLSLGLSLLYNLAAGTAAILGYIDPLVAAVLMPTSSLILVVSMLLFKPFGSRV